MIRRFSCENATSHSGRKSGLSRYMRAQTRTVRAASWDHLFKRLFYRQVEDPARGAVRRPMVTYLHEIIHYAVPNAPNRRTCAPVSE